MANRKLTMRKIKEILRLKWELKLSDRQTGQSVNIAHSTVGEYLKRAERAGLDWETVKSLGEDELNSKLFPPVLKNKLERPQPDWKEVEKDMQGKHVTLMLLWKEYIDQHPEGYGYSQFCQKYRRWQKVTAKPVMRIPKKIGEEVQVDYSGQTMQYTDPSTGEVQKVQIFVGVLGASGLIYAEAHKSQAIPNWIRAHVRMLEFFGGAPKLIRPDNLKSGVTTPSFYDPDINPTYHELATHYGIAVIPTRVAKPKDKALSENAVLQVARWIIAPLRKQRFFSLHKLNQAVAKRLTWLNNRKRSHNEISRRDWFEERERDGLYPLPKYAFEYLEVKKIKVPLDYHIMFKKQRYSVPHTYTRKAVVVRASERMVEIYHDQERVACHVRQDKIGWTTHKEHMPQNHRWMLEWSPQRFSKWALQIGEHTEKMVMSVLGSSRHPEQGYRACLGILKLGHQHGDDLLEAACKLALAFDTHSYRVVKNILATKKDMLKTNLQPAVVDHEHIRGQIYYS